MFQVRYRKEKKSHHHGSLLLQPLAPGWDDKSLKTMVREAAKHSDEVVMMSENMSENTIPLNATDLDVLNQELDIPVKIGSFQHLEDGNTYKDYKLRVVMRGEAVKSDSWNLI